MVDTRSQEAEGAAYDVADAPAPRPSLWMSVLVGAVLGLAWAAAFRAFMAEIAGGASRFEWYGTFGGILAAGVIAGSLLGWIWARVLCGILTIAFLVAIAFTVPAVGGTRLVLDQPRGAWVAILAVTCVIVLALASSIPFRRVVHVGDTIASAGAR